MQPFNLEGKKAAIVVSAGGHLFEAMLLRQRLRLSLDTIYITHRNPQTQSLLKDLNHIFIPRIDSRDLKGAIAAMPRIVKILRKLDIDLILSTGAAPAVSCVPAHFILCKPFFYFESLTRVIRPSLTGRILELFPSIQKFSSNSNDFGSKWKAAPNLLEVYKVRQRQGQSRSLRILVTMGTISNYRFDRLVEEVLRIVEEGDVIHWQLGCTTRNDLPGVSHQTIPSNELIKLAKSSDIVISHCGIGTILELLSHGIRPLVMPRNMKFGEHVDNHQLEASKSFEELNLISVINSPLTREKIHAATSSYVVKAES